MIAYNGSGSSALAGSLMGVLDNCFTVGWAAEREKGGKRGGEEKKGRGGETEERRGRRRREQPAEDRERGREGMRENREQGHLSLLLIGY